MKGRKLKYGEKAKMFSTKVYSWEKEIIRAFIQALRSLYGNDTSKELKGKNYEFTVRERNS